MAIFEKSKPTSGVEQTTTTPSTQTPAAAPAPASYASSSSKAVATIGASIRVKGEITGEENLVIEGKVEGSIELKTNDVTIGQSGALRANVRAKVIHVHGEVQGDLHGIEKVVVYKTGRIHGNILSPRVILEDGAKFKGTIDMDTKEASSADSSIKQVHAARVQPITNPDDLIGALKTN